MPRDLPSAMQIAIQQAADQARRVAERAGLWNDGLPHGEFGETRELIDDIELMLLPPTGR
jgi:hypothetical protein